MIISIFPTRIKYSSLDHINNQWMIRFQIKINNYFQVKLHRHLHLIITNLCHFHHNFLLFTINLINKVRICLWIWIWDTIHQVQLPCIHLLWQNKNKKLNQMIILQILVILRQRKKAENIKNKGRIKKKIKKEIEENINLNIERIGILCRKK